MFAGLTAMFMGAAKLVFAGFFFCIGFLSARFSWDLLKGVASEATITAAEY
jgi:hypothetical protein